jgi:hypothetical protein
MATGPLTCTACLTPGSVDEEDYCWCCGKVVRPPRSDVADSVRSTGAETPQPIMKG